MTTPTASINDAGYCNLCEQDVGHAAVNVEIHMRQCAGRVETRCFEVRGLTGVTRYDLSFKAWKAQVNKALVKACGLGADDLGDAEYWSGWDSGTMPYDMAQQVLEENGWPGDDVPDGEDE